MDHPTRTRISTRTLLLTAAVLTVIAVGFALFVFAAGRFISEQPGAQRVAPLQPDTAVPTEFSFAPPDRLRPVPEIHFVDGDGRAMTLANFRGRAVLLNIWATWCVPCRKEMPTLDRLQAKLGGPDFEVVTLSIDRGGVPVVKQFYEELGLKSLGIYVDRSTQAASTLGAVGIPTTLLVDGQGREIGRKVGPAEWDSPDVVQIIREHLLKRRTGDSEPLVSPDHR